jgi:hypothetical protein
MRSFTFYEEVFEFSVALSLFSTFGGDFLIKFREFLSAEFKLDLNLTH